MPWTRLPSSQGGISPVRAASVCSVSARARARGWRSAIRRAYFLTSVLVAIGRAGLMLCSSRGSPCSRHGSLTDQAGGVGSASSQQITVEAFGDHLTVFDEGDVVGLVEHQ